MRRKCKIPECGEPAKGIGLCQRHYDQYYGRIRRERDKVKRRDCPFLKFQNPYRPTTGYHIIFDIIRQNRPLTKEQILSRAKIEMKKIKKPNYRVDYAFEILRMPTHACKKGDYQLCQDDKGFWHLNHE